MSRDIKIDITDKVMNKIRTGNIRMRPRWNYSLFKAVIVAGAVGAGLLTLVAAVALIFSFKNQVFVDYLSFGTKGQLDFIKTLPWFALLSVVALIASFIYLVKDFNFVYKYKYIPAMLMLILVVFGGTAYGMQGSSPDSVQAKLAAVFRLNSKTPVKISGIVEKVDNSKIILRKYDGFIAEIKISSATIYKNGQPEAGDSILVFGLSNDDFEAMAIKIVKKSEPKKQEEKGEVKSENTQTQPAPASTPEQPKNNTQSSTPAPKPAPTPAPTPPPLVGKIITITGTSGPLVYTPYYKVSWVANYSAAAFKLVWSKSPNPTYPSSYNLWVTGGTSGSGKVTKNDLAPVTYYVRVCEFLGGTCGVYSNQVTVSF